MKMKIELTLENIQYIKVFFDATDDAGKTLLLTQVLQLCSDHSNSHDHLQRIVSLNSVLPALGGLLQAGDNAQKGVVARLLANMLFHLPAQGAAISDLFTTNADLLPALGGLLQAGDNAQKDVVARLLVNMLFHLPAQRTAIGVLFSANADLLPALGGLLQAGGNAQLGVVARLLVSCLKWLPAQRAAISALFTTNADLLPALGGLLQAGDNAQKDDVARLLANMLFHLPAQRTAIGVLFSANADLLPALGRLLQAGDNAQKGVVARLLVWMIFYLPAQGAAISDLFTTNAVLLPALGGLLQAGDNAQKDVVARLLVSCLKCLPGQRAAISDLFTTNADLLPALGGLLQAGDNAQKGIFARLLRDMLYHLPAQRAAIGVLFSANADLLPALGGLLQAGDNAQKDVAARLLANMLFHLPAQREAIKKLFLDNLNLRNIVTDLAAQEKSLATGTEQFTQCHKNDSLALFDSPKRASDELSSSGGAAASVKQEGSVYSINDDVIRRIITRLRTTTSGAAAGLSVFSNAQRNCATLLTDVRDAICHYLEAGNIPDKSSNSMPSDHNTAPTRVSDEDTFALTQRGLYDKNSMQDHFQDQGSSDSQAAESELVQCMVETDEVKKRSVTLDKLEAVLCVVGGPQATKLVELSWWWPQEPEQPLRGHTMGALVKRDAFILFDPQRLSAETPDQSPIYPSLQSFRDYCATNKITEFRLFDLHEWQQEEPIQVDSEQARKKIKQEPGMRAEQGLPS